MGRGTKPRELACPRGITVREFKTERRIQVAFSYRGVECRELLPPQNITQTALTMAAGLRAEIQRKIAADSFVYGDYFPHSERASQFDNGGRRAMVDKLLEAQLERYEHQVANGTLSPSTLEGYRKAINSERMAHWKGKTVAEVTPAALRSWIGAMGVTAKRARNLLTPLRSVMEDALNDELIKFNPFDRLALNKLLKQTSKASDYEVDPFTAAERQALLAKCRADELPLIRFWLATGLRPGELIALRWNRIDWAGRTARIDINFVARTEKAPKTAAGVRDVHLDDDALAALIAQKPATFQAGEHVFHNPRTGEAWDSDAKIRKTLWQPLAARAGVRYRNPYQCRHTFASAHLTAGANPWWLAEQLGHVDVQMVFQIYGKFIAADFRKPATARPLRVVGGEG